MPVYLNPGRRLILGGALLILPSGCTDYPAVGTLSSGLQKSVSSWKPLADDYAGTCTRREAYNAALGTANDPCSLEAVTQLKLDDTLAVLDNYFGALGAVATDSNYSVDPAIDSLGQAAKDITKDTAKVAAITGIAKFLSGLVTSNIRQRTMSSLIDQARNADAVVDVVKDVIGVKYAKNLSSEADQLHGDAMFAAAQAGLGVTPLCKGARLSWIKPPPTTATAAQILFQRDYASRCNNILAKQAALTTFSNSVALLKKSLEDLEKSRDKLKSKDTVKLLVQRASQLYDNVRAVNKAFS